jgi:hypothetical protein
MAKNVAKEPIEQLTQELKSLLQQIDERGKEADARTKGRTLKALEEASIQLGKVATNLDPILRPDSVFDPSAPDTIGRIIALTMVAQKRHPLSQIPEFYGSGIYAIYYKGDYDAYQALAGTEHPIYVGKADPNDQTAQDAVAQGVKLSARMREHAKNIGKATTTLKLSDFECRFLIVKSGFQSSAEKYLIDFFQPIWNSETKICFGLGKHGDSATTRVNKRSPWDTLHPGRSWADKTLENQKSPELIQEEIAAHFRANPPYQDSHEIFDHFNEEMRQLSTESFYTLAGDVVDIPDTPSQD